SRTAPIAQIAVFDAVNSIVGDYEPYHEKIDAPAGASQESAVVAAAHRALVKLHSAKAPQLDELRDKSLQAIPDGPGKKAGIALGIAAADGILAIRADDGFFTPVPYTPGTEPGEYRPTPPEFIPAFMPWLGRVRTFVIRNGRQFRSVPPPGLRSKQYARNYEEVERVGEARSGERPEDRTRVARFYDATDADGVYYPAARQIMAVRNRTFSENARFFAVLAIAIFDSAVACFETKYHFNLWRPVTAIHEGASDDNPKTEPDVKWRALVFTPPFPAYPSGHASFGGAARAVLEEEFGPDGHAITLTNPVVPDITLHYTTFKRITDDIDDARIYGGVHYRFDQEAGALQGKRVGEYVMRHALPPACDRDHRGKTRKGGGGARKDR
ncbi:MAG: vanadium-dependent haloperoxidase, partial [Steroidobacteraceae bacterium]